jgi:hypothetical protein
MSTVPTAQTFQLNTEDWTELKNTKNELQNVEKNFFGKLTRVVFTYSYDLGVIFT